MDLYLFEVTSVSHIYCVPGYRLTPFVALGIPSNDYIAADCGTESGT
jgi:hypothetical protein